jgi:hypothetical protein
MEELDGGFFVPSVAYACRGFTNLKTCTASFAGIAMA